MARLARVVVSGVPHHVMQCGVVTSEQADHSASRAFSTGSKESSVAPCDRPNEAPSQDNRRPIKYGVPGIPRNSMRLRSIPWFVCPRFSRILDVPRECMAQAPVSIRLLNRHMPHDGPTAGRYGFAFPFVGVR